MSSVDEQSGQQSAPSPQTVEAAPPPDLEVPGLCVVIPAYNEATRLPGTLERVISYLHTRTYPWSVIVVDDGSEDSTLILAQEWSQRERRIQVIANDHRGKAYTVRTGILAATLPFVVFSDADLSVPIEELERLLPPLIAGADVVIGSREGSGAKRFNEPGYRHVMGRIYNLLYRTALLPGIQDSQCGFKAFRTEVAHRLFQRMLLYGADAKPIRGGMVTGFDIELLFLARRWKLSFVEVGVEWYYGRASKVRPVRDTVRMVVDVVRILLYARLGRYDRMENVG
ncbi:MAG: glycosyltransferase family 2 protein [Chloroflexi bacterium]|nr:glycosyltransferase family 2 protein [Chloroflexota bacterium]